MSKKLDEYNFPGDLKSMSLEEMNLLATEIREFLIDNISKTGGHLASNLGIVELSIGLHTVFNSPKDKIVWDVGHQSYVHKILTERSKGFKNLRKLNGMSGFPRTSESPHDAFDTGHSSTSISVVAGLAKARDLKGEKFETIAVIGDGSLTGGLAYEALNNLGVSKSKSIIIVNDNGMSINQNTGGVSKHLGKLRLSKGYYGFKKKFGGALKKVPGVGNNLFNGLEKFRDTLKYALVDGVIFEELGFTYIGPIDGHNLEDIIENLKLAKKADEPVVLHVITKKGKGYRNAEQNPGKFHGTGPFDATTGMLLKEKKLPTYSEIFGDKLIELAKENDKIVAITAAMTDGTGLAKFQRQFPDRTFDVGIAEAYGVTFAGGMAVGGMHPVVAIYSTFLQRAYDQMIIDVCLQHLPVVFAIDRAGNVGEDGETHHGIFDLSYLSHMPGMTILAPRDGYELTKMLAYAFSIKGPCAIRYPRGENGDLDYPRTPLAEGSEVIKTGSDVEIWAIGSMVKTANQVINKLEKKGINAGLVNGRFIKPLDEKKLITSSKRTSLIITLEDNVVAGGYGEKISGFLQKENNIKVINFGWPDKFIEHGSCNQLYERYDLDCNSLTERISELIERKA